MPTIQICDADGKTVLTADNAHSCGWGRKRIYSSEAYMDVEAYYNALQAGAVEARKLFQERQAAAAKTFHDKYPDGKLPDDETDNDEVNTEEIAGTPITEAKSVSPDPVTTAGCDAK